MPIIIEEVTAEAIKPASPAKTGEPAQYVPATDSDSHSQTLAALRRAEARRERLRAD
ncbi:MAG: hypothetical protein ACPGNV_06805 [Mangrovicoccus sp.]